MSDITIIHKQHDGTVLNTFRPENLAFTLNKGENGPHEVTYEISRANVSLDFVGAKRTDFELKDGSTTIMAGIHTLAPEITTDQEHVKLAGKDWLHYLEGRYWPYNDSDPNYYRKGIPATTADEPPTGFAYYVVTRDSADIMTDILDQVLSLANSLDLTYSLSSIGHSVEVFSINLIDTENILSKFQTLSQEDPGEFDFFVTKDKVFTVVAPRQYDIGVVTDDSLAEHTFDTSIPSSGIFELSFANTGPTETRLIGTGSNPSSSLVAVREYVPASEEFRLWERIADFGDVFNTQRIQRLTRKELLFDLNPVHEVTLSVIPESVTNFWTTFKPGKAIWVTGDLEAHAIDAAFEIVSIDGTSDSNGNVLAVFKLNQIYTPATL